MFIIVFAVDTVCRWITFALDMFTSTIYAVSFFTTVFSGWVKHWHQRQRVTEVCGRNWKCLSPTVISLTLITTFLGEWSMRFVTYFSSSLNLFFNLLIICQSTVWIANAEVNVSRILSWVISLGTPNSSILFWIGMKVSNQLSFWCIPRSLWKISLSSSVL